MPAHINELLSILTGAIMLQLLPTTFDGDEFPGYDNVRLSYMQLSSILERRKQSWITALENQKAVYLIILTKVEK